MFSFKTTKKLILATTIVGVTALTACTHPNWLDMPSQDSTYDLQLDLNSVQPVENEANTYYFLLLGQPTAEAIKDGIEEPHSMTLYAKVNCDTKVLYYQKVSLYEELNAKGELKEEIQAFDRSESLGDDPDDQVLLDAICKK